MTILELVAKIEQHLGVPTTGLWRASKPTLEAILHELDRLSEYRTFHHDPAIEGEEDEHPGYCSTCHSTYDNCDCEEWVPA